MWKRKGIKKDKKRAVRKKRSSSTFFMLWAIFTIFALFIVTIFSFSQATLLKSTYKKTIAQNIVEKGKIISSEPIIKDGLYEENANKYSGWIQTRSLDYHLDIFILKKDGSVLFPDVDMSWKDEHVKIDFSNEVQYLLSRKEVGRHEDFYQYNGTYVYVKELPYFETEMDQQSVYLYIYSPLEIGKNLTKEMTVRTLIVAVFMVVLSFAIAGIASGWLTRPLSEITEKAKKLAGGDFTVDFGGKDYSEEVIELADMLNYAKDELSKADSMQKELIANVSHDFKTPLTMIKAYSSMIMEISGDNPEKRNKHLGIIIEEADRLTSLVSDVLDLSKIRSGINIIKKEVFDLSEYTNEIIDRFSYLSETQGYVFIRDIDAEIYTDADYLKIGQALYNLISNAVNYTGSDKKVLISLKRIENGTAKFFVSDTGKGISKEEISTIWDRYYRSKENHKRPVQGTGLGLSIVKTVLEKHGFLFGVDSEEDKGSTFYVLFPIASKAQEGIIQNNVDT